LQTVRGSSTSSRINRVGGGATLRLLRAALELARVVQDDAGKHSGEVPYVAADPQRRRAMARATRAATTIFKVGIVWAGQPVTSTIARVPLRSPPSSPRSPLVAE
jgi:hypothetical protein